MIGRIILATIIFAIGLFSCSSSVQMLPEPIENKNLLIGSLMFDIDGYEDNFTTIRQNIEVVIIGRFVEDGNIKNFSQWVTTDENGYFFIANVPDGEYAIKGFRTHLIGLGNLTIENELIDPQRNYFELKGMDVISMTGNLFDVRSDQRIVNFRYNIITLHRSSIIDNRRYDRLQDVKLSTGEVLNSPPIPIYFLEKFERTGWENYLNSQLK
jgi:hypothetical protein